MCIRDSCFNHTLGIVSLFSVWCHNNSPWNNYCKIYFENLIFLSKEYQVPNTHLQFWKIGWCGPLGSRKALVAQLAGHTIWKANFMWTLPKGWPSHLCLWKDPLPLLSRKMLLEVTCKFNFDRICGYTKSNFITQNIIQQHKEVIFLYFGFVCVAYCLLGVSYYAVLLSEGV